jgi:hypothetical protein
LKGASEGLFISAKRYALTRPDNSFVDFKESILGMLSPPSSGWSEEAWRTLGEMWDARPLTLRPWFDLPAMRPLAVTSPAYAREMKGLPLLRPWNSFLAASVIGRKADERERRTAVAVAPFERDPEKWGGLSWRFAESGEHVTFDQPDSEGFRWRLRTLRDFLSSYARHATLFPRCSRPTARVAALTPAAYCNAARCETASIGFCSRKRLSTAIIRATPSRSRRRKRSAGGTRSIATAPLRFGRAR